MRDHRFGQLDAVRAFAVLAVVACHTFDVERQRWAEYGAYGVQLFFVISGFLITGILIDARRDADRVGAQPMARRVPLASTAAGAAHLPRLLRHPGDRHGDRCAGMREHLGWNLLYLSNWRIALDGQWGTVTHIWSLAVEEQFYLVWPFVVLLGAAPAAALGDRLDARRWPWSRARCSRRRPTCGRTASPSSPLPSWMRWGSAPCWPCCGGSRPNADRIVAWIGVLAVAVLRVRPVTVEPSVPRCRMSRAVTDIWWSLLFVWIVHRAARGVRGPLGTVLAWRPLAYIGTVSYGIYLFHLFVVPVAEIVERNAGIDLPIPSPGFGRFVVVAAISIAAAALSWTIFERPINNQKHRFPYVRSGVSGTSPAIPAAAAATCGWCPVPTPSSTDVCRRRHDGSGQLGAPAVTRAISATAATVAEAVRRSV